jgi:hypothetical protein
MYMDPRVSAGLIAIAALVSAAVDVTWMRSARRSHLDFWRAEAVEPDRLLRLRAEMKVPGKAWLEFQSEPSSVGDRQGDKTLFTVTAYFEPYGLAGFLYWYAMWPFHSFLFDGLTRRLASRARVLTHTFPLSPRERGPG